MSHPIPTFRNFVGHKKIVARLRQQVDGAKLRREPFPHMLLTGTSGVGKTMLARAAEGSPCGQGLPLFGRGQHWI
jgi:Holliday junction resolvasome RuvABC ATP-dependent DNA helicase subunit